MSDPKKCPQLPNEVLSLILENRLTEVCILDEEENTELYARETKKLARVSRLFLAIVQAIVKKHREITLYDDVHTVPLIRERLREWRKKARKTTNHALRKEYAGKKLLESAELERTHDRRLKVREAHYMLKSMESRVNWGRAC